MKAQSIAEYDEELWAAMSDEWQRQQDHIELIASENYVSPCVLAAQGSVLTNKYAEGYPGKRYYGGCEHVDKAENLAILRAKELFGADYANVQPHSGSQANAAAYMALINSGDTVLGMGLSDGGHLTHGAKVNFSGKQYHFVSYGVDALTHQINYDEVAELAKTHKPKLIVAGFSAYSRIIDWQKFRDIANDVGAFFMVDMAHIAGLVAAGIYPNPMPYADVVTSTTHKTLRGPRGGLILCNNNPDLAKKLNSAVFPGLQGGPLMHVIAAKAVAFKEALSAEFKEYQTQVVANAKEMAKVFMDRGFDIVSGGTDNHLMLLDLTSRNITGKEADALLGQANITVNKNTVPNETRSPFITSGLRLGTAAITTRGFKVKDINLLTHWMCDLLEEPNSLDRVDVVRQQVLTLCQDFPVYR